MTAGDRRLPDRRIVLTGLGLGGLGLGGLGLGGFGLGVAGLGAAVADAPPPPGGASVAELARQRAAARARARELALEVRDSTTDLDGTSAAVNQAVAAVTQVSEALRVAQAQLATAQSELATATAVDRQLATVLARTRTRLAGAQADLDRTRAGVLAHSNTVGVIARNSYTHAQLPGLLGYLGSGPDPDLLGARHTVETVITGENETIADLRTLTRQEQTAAVRFAALEAQTAEAKAGSDAAVQRVGLLTDVARRRAQTLSDLLVQRQQVLATAQRARGVALAQFQLADAERSRNQATLRSLAIAERRAVARDRAQALARQKAAAAQRRKVADRQSQQGAPTGTGAGAHRLAYPVIAPITSPFGMRFHPILHIWELHDGTDFGCPTGTPIHAAASGTIISTYFNVAYGNRVIMDNGIIDGIPLGTSYNHLSRFLVSPGQHVEVGQTVALSGATGWVTGPHLHFMVYENGTPVDPMTWL